MKTFRNILLVCDEEGIHAAVIERSIRLAKESGARVTLIDILDSAPGDLAKMFAALPGSRARDFESEVLGIRHARLAETAAVFRAEGIDTKARVLQGIPFVEVIRTVLRDGYDLVIKGAAGERSGGTPIFASTDLHILRKCPCPVWVIKTSEHRMFARVLAAVDPDPENEQTRALNTQILDLATSVSSLDGGDLHIVNAWKLDEEDALRQSGISAAAEAELDLVLEQRRARSEVMMSDLMSDYRGEGSARRVHSIKGAAPKVIPEFAARQEIDLIVMGTVARTGIRGLIVGSTAEAILGHVECSVLAVKPPSFETPVQIDQDTAVMAATAAQSRRARPLPRSVWQ